LISGSSRTGLKFFYEIFVEILRVEGQKVDYSPNHETQDLTKIKTFFMKSQHFVKIKKNEKYRGGFMILPNYN